MAKTKNNATHTAAKMAASANAYLAAPKNAKEANAQIKSVVEQQRHILDELAKH